MTNEIEAIRIANDQCLKSPIKNRKSKSAIADAPPFLRPVRRWRGRDCAQSAAGSDGIGRSCADTVKIDPANPLVAAAGTFSARR